MVHWERKGEMEVGLEHIKEKSKTCGKQKETKQTNNHHQGWDLYENKNGEKYSVLIPTKSWLLRANGREINFYLFSGLLPWPREHSEEAHLLHCLQPMGNHLSFQRFPPYSSSTNVFNYRDLYSSTILFKKIRGWNSKWWRTLFHKEVKATGKAHLVIFASTLWTY